MIWLGLKKHTAGYWQRVREFERHGTPLPKKMRKPLLEEIANARTELDRLERAAIAR